MHFKSKPKVNEKSKTTKLKHELVQKHPQNDAIHRFARNLKPGISFDFTLTRPGTEIQVMYVCMYVCAI